MQRDPMWPVAVVAWLALLAASSAQPTITIPAGHIPQTGPNEIADALFRSCSAGMRVRCEVHAVHALEYVPDGDGCGSGPHWLVDATGAFSFSAPLSSGSFSASRAVLTVDDESATACGLQPVPGWK